MTTTYRSNSGVQKMPVSLQIVQKFYPEVTKVVDARADLIFNLRASDVKSAKAKKHDGCALAQACKRQCHVDGAIVSTRTAYLISGTKATRYYVPESVSREIVAFDRGAGFELGAYCLQKPYKYAPRGSGTGHGHPKRGAGRLKAQRSNGLREALSAL
jgi:hypothetical protein